MDSKITNSESIENNTNTDCNDKYEHIVDTNDVKEINKSNSNISKLLSYSKM